MFFTSIEYKNPIPLNEELPKLQLDELKNVLLVSGIANPKPAMEKLSAFASVEHLAFPDHHNFLKEDFELIARRYGSYGTINHWKSVWRALKRKMLETVKK